MFKLGYLLPNLFYILQSFEKVWSLNVSTCLHSNCLGRKTVDSMYPEVTKLGTI